MYIKIDQRAKALWMIQLKNSQRIWEYMRRPLEGERESRQTRSKGYLDPDEQEALKSVLKGPNE